MNTFDHNDFVCFYQRKKLSRVLSTLVGLWHTSMFDSPKVQTIDGGYLDGEEESL